MADAGSPAYFKYSSTKALPNFGTFSFTPALLTDGEPFGLDASSYGRYSCIGNRLFVDAYIYIASDVGVSGNVRIDCSLPDTSGIHWQQSIGTAQIATSANSVVVASKSSSEFYLYEQSTAAVNTLTLLDAAQVIVGSEIYLSANFALS